jgi:hypothetical protein
MIAYSGRLSAAATAYSPIKSDGAIKEREIALPKIPLTPAFALKLNAGESPIDAGSVKPPKPEETVLVIPALRPAAIPFTIFRIIKKPFLLIQKFVTTDPLFAMICMGVPKFIIILRCLLFSARNNIMFRNKGIVTFILKL